MKLTILIMTLFLIQVSAKTSAQITIREKNTTLQKVMRAISSQSGYDFVYSNTDFKDLKPVSITLTNASVEEALRTAFSGQPLIYEVSEKTVMVKRKEQKEESFIERIKNYLASINVRGSVIDERGQPMSGVNVSVKGGKATIATDSYGAFYLKSVDENAVLVFSFLGYITQEISVNGKEIVDMVKMKLSESKLDEVQIQAYGKTSKRLSTSTITTIKAEDIEKQPIDNPLYALMGRVPGLSVIPQSGMSGAAVKVQIRGQNSLNEVNSEPLFVIDGVPVINNMAGYTQSPYGAPLSGNAQYGDNTQISALNFLNTKDIESIDVLKDADATAIYGSRGANGVILITTKKGKIGETRIDAGFSNSFSYVGKKYDLMNTQQYLQMRKQAYINDGLPVPDLNVPGSQKTSNNFDLTVWDQNRYTDWQKVLLGGTARNYVANASISGGSPTVRYLVGGNFSRQGSVFLGDGHTVNGSARLELSGNSADNKFRSNLSAIYTGIDTSTPSDFSNVAYTLAPNAPSLYNADGGLNWEPNPGSMLGEATWNNPLSSLLRQSTSTNNTLQASLGLSYQLLPNLDLSIRSGISKAVFESFRADPIASKKPEIQNFATGNAYLDNNKANTWSVEPQLDYKTNISRGKLNILLGGAYQGESRRSQYLSQGNYTSDALLRSLSFGTTTSSISSSSDYRYMAFFGRINYNWDEKYILNVSGRRDGSSRFGPGHQFGNFGSSGLAWLFTNENFLKDKIPFLSFGKLRASYGTNGNDGIGDYQYLQILYADGGKYQNSDLLSSIGAVNPDYHWESKRSLELGVDLGFFKDRLSVSGSYFRSRSSEQLLETVLPITAGAGGIKINDASTKIQNSGFELTFTSQNISTSNFKWTTNFNLSFLNKNKILDGNDGGLPGRLYSLYGNKYSSVKQLIGKPFSGVVAVYEYRGIDQSKGLYQFTAEDGSAQSEVGFSSKVWDGYAKLINTAPQYYGGLSNQFSYKGFTVDIFLQFSKQLGKSPIFNLSSGVPGMINYNLPAAFADYWTPGKNSLLQKVVTFENFQTAIPVIFTNEKIVQSDASWVDASFVRVKNISASYQFPEGISKKLKLKNLNLGITAQNLFTITGYQGIDPETQSIGSLPPLRIISFNLRVGL